jgi:hypothetical protein
MYQTQPVDKSQTRPDRSVRSLLSPRGVRFRSFLSGVKPPHSRGGEGMDMEYGVETFI